MENKYNVQPNGLVMADDMDFLIQLCEEHNQIGSKIHIPYRMVEGENGEPLFECYFLPSMGGYFEILEGCTGRGSTFQEASDVYFENSRRRIHDEYYSHLPFEL